MVFKCRAVFFIILGAICLIEVGITGSENYALVIIFSCCEMYLVLLVILSNAWLIDRMIVVLLLIWMIIALVFLVVRVTELHSITLLNYYS